MFLAEVKVDVSWTGRFQGGAGYVVGPQQSRAVPPAPEKKGKVTDPSAMVGHFGKAGWVRALLVGERQLGLRPVQAGSGQGCARIQ